MTRIEAAVADRQAERDALAARHSVLRARMMEAVAALDSIIRPEGIS